MHALSNSIPHCVPADVEQAASMHLAKMPRDGSHVRMHDMCVVTGKSRGLVKPFGLCRNTFRQMALYNMIPGVTKSSW
jgi:small subunit ribosomal protein S14